MSLYQVVEKDSFGTDWQPVRYYDKALTRFDDEQSARQAAIDYVTDRNCNNALTKEEKLQAAEVFMMTDDGVFLGVLDRTPWYMTYPRDTMSSTKEACTKGDVVKDRKYFGLEGKTEVSVRTIPGT